MEPERGLLSPAWGVVVILAVLVVIGILAILGVEGFGGGNGEERGQAQTEVAKAREE